MSAACAGDAGTVDAVVSGAVEPRAAETEGSGFGGTGAAIAAGGAAAGGAAARPFGSRSGRMEPMGAMAVGLALGRLRGRDDGAAAVSGAARSATARSDGGRSPAGGPAPTVSTVVAEDAAADRAGPAASRADVALAVGVTVAEGITLAVAAVSPLRPTGASSAVGRTSSATAT
ncbi:hypothetical protein [Rhodoplanes serenus]|uniref:hypothetical protein n=1 Tax=Rhodoplanes serenus TaxID=200615 RepID=UPI0011B93B43|nr:hypothetical protein [Rhodoplanes serenus]